MNVNKTHIIPHPILEKRENKEIKIGRIGLGDFTLSFESSGPVFESARELILKTLRDKCAVTSPTGKYKIRFAIDEASEAFADKSDEAYSVSIGEGCAVILSKTDRGAYYAAKAFADQITVRGEGIYLPLLELFDAPKFRTRGPYFESRYNDFMSLDDWKGAVDYVAGMKNNVMCVGVYTCWSYQYDGKFSEFLYLPFEKHPELEAKNVRRYYSVKEERFVVTEPERPTMAREDFFGELVKYGKTRNVEVFPLFNSLGHNTVLPRMHPEISAIGEDGLPRGFGMCTKNPKTYELMFDIYDEIIDKYLVPNGVRSINLGLDEVNMMTALDSEGKRVRRDPICRCEKCKDRAFIDLFCEYVIELLKHLKKKGMENVYICYDMFFEHGVLNETFAKMLKDNGVYDITVIVWWGYGAGVEFFRGKADRINDLFRSVIMPMAGYENWTAFSDNTENIAEDAALAERLGAEGMFSYCTYDKMYEYDQLYFADACWSPTDGDFMAHRARFIKDYIENLYPSSPSEALDAWHNVAYRLHPYNYTERPPSNGEYMPYGFSYVAEGRAYPREYVGELLEKISRDRERHLGYMKDFIERAESTLAFLNSPRADVSLPSEYLKLNILHISTQISIILSLFTLKERCDGEKLSKEELVSLFNGLIAKQRALMLAHENIRMPSTLHHPLRILSATLEYLYECREKIASGELDGYYPDKMIDRDAPVFKLLR